MKKIFFPFISILLSVTIVAQPTKKSSPDQTYGNGSKTETTGGKNVNGEREDYTEYYDAGHNKKEMKTVTHKENGDTVVTRVTYDCNGGQTSKSEIRKDRNGKKISEMYEQYDEKNKAVARGYKIIYENGEEKTYLYNTYRDEYEPISSLPPDAFPAIDRESVCCKPRSLISVDYSGLFPIEENEESIPLGVHLAYTYLLTGSFGLVGDFSLHSKKENNLRIMKAFLMGGVQYYILKKREERTHLFARLLAGIANDRQKYSFNNMSGTNKAAALAIALGLGLEYQITRRVAACVMADYMLTRFNDEFQSAIRASAGVRFNLGCK
jgi:hypothetical protein